MPNLQERCPVEQKLGLEKALELDAFLADPALWPKAIFAGWDIPPGRIPGNFRSWGAIKVGLEWCSSREVEITRHQMERHVAQHVPLLAYTPDDVATRGVTADGTGNDGSEILPTNIITYQQVYQRGLSIGYKAIGLLEERIDEIREAEEKVPTDLLLKLADLGTKLATSQAAIMVRGLDLNREKDDEIEGFRSGSAPLPSQRFGHHRIRTIEGESRPVADQGPADRKHYNERADQEGSPRLPSP